VPPKSVLVIAGVWVGDAFSGTLRGRVGSIERYAARGGVSSVARSSPGWSRACQNTAQMEYECVWCSRCTGARNVKPMAGFAVQFADLTPRCGCARPPPDSASAGPFGVPLVPIGVWPMTEHAVVIAGGGREGSGGELALAGIDVAIVERRATRT